jgi:tetratricopeptide (TPR) repeat protein
VELPKKNKLSGYAIRLRKKKVFKSILKGMFIVMAAAVCGLIVWKMGGKFVDEKARMQELWANGSYQEIFDISGEILENAPLDYESLILHGFSAYQRALAQITTPNKAAYIDKCINCLRKALTVTSTGMDGPIHYVLGKAYYGKGTKYADLAVQSLERAKELEFLGEDTNEYLGIAYAALHDYRSSVRAFTEAMNLQGINAQHPDALLMAIAASYNSLEDVNMAAAYLTRCIDISKDDNARRQARFELGSIYYKLEEYSEAENQYTTILNDFGESAEAHYRLGEINAAKNNLIRARAEWRKAIQIDPAHKSARSRLSMG